MSDLEQAMAIDIINLMKAMASKKKDEVSNDEERGRIREEIEMYCYEEGGIKGRYGDEKARRSMYGKVFNMYSPLIRKIYGSQRIHHSDPDVSHS